MRKLDEDQIKYITEVVMDKLCPDDFGFTLPKCNGGDGVECKQCWMDCLKKIYCEDE